MIYEGKEMCYWLPETVCKWMSNSVSDNNNNKTKQKTKSKAKNPKQNKQTQKGGVIYPQIETPWSDIFAIQNILMYFSSEN